jgi:hypothetical protein
MSVVSVGPKVQVELRLRAAELKSLDLTSKNDPLIVVSEKRRAANFNEIGRTEILQNTK